MLSALPAQIINSEAVGMYPTHLRGMAINIALMFGRIGTIVGSNYFGSLLMDYCQLSFYICGASLIGSALLSLLTPLLNSRKGSDGKV